MPTADRRAFVPAAVAGFLRQTCEDAELLVLDNGREPVADLVPAHPRVRYVREGAKRSLGALRNRACELALGEFILHWDDDDWYAPDRIERQLQALQAGDADVCGSSRIYFHDPAARRAWQYRYADTRRTWLAGATLAYRRAFWEGHRFADVQVGEDARFLWCNGNVRLADLDSPGLCVARVHAGNTSPKRPTLPSWQPVDPAVVEALVGAVQVPARKVVVGLRAAEDPAALERTRASLGTAAGVELVVRLLADEDGGAACFNRLVAPRDADVFVLLEAGALAGPGWLPRLLSALDADPAHGLAGPTTNRSWNAQGAFDRAGAHERSVDAMARLAAQRHGDAWQRLDRLHCLADFCYAVRREVVEAIGAADEGYGRGPCWEMDYTLRAARAGFVAVWAQGAYVHRAPPGARRQREEAEGFEASRRRYQDKFCGLRLAGGREGYASHCRGEDCPHFAPPGAVQRVVPFGAQPVPRADPLPGRVSAPLVSCIVPTRDRLDWLLQSVAYFQRQDWPARELIVVDDGVQPVKDRLPCDPRIRVLRLDRCTSIGTKRNLACEAAAGDFIAHWDDDDWHGPGRLSAQMAPLLQGAADITAFEDTWFFELEGWRFWRCEPALYARLFQGAVLGGSMVFRRRLHDRATRYPDASLAEDAAFLRAATRRGARLLAQAAVPHYLYLRHGSNSWRLARDLAPGSAGWQAMEEPAWLAPDRGYYLARRAAMTARNAA